MKKALLIITILLAGFSNTFASHIPGGNLTWTCTGNPNEYIVTMQLFVSCPSTLGTSYNATATNSCGLPNPNLNLTQVGTQQNVSQICPADSLQGDCATGSSGGIPGVWMYTYSATVTLAGPCNTWDFAFDLCCRDASTNTNNGSSNNMYFHSGMNSQTAPCDNSPYVTAQPIPYVCAGTQQTYCPGAIDPDGDNLVYTLVSPLGGGGVPITNPAPYTPAAPLQNLVLDPVTGCITFNQPTIGNFVVTYLIEAFDAAGNMTGFIYHDFQFEVLNNANCQPPVGPAIVGIQNLTGSGTLLNLNTIEVCEGQNICFDLEFSDPDPGDTLTMDMANTNVIGALPGAIITQTGTNPTIFNICWTVPAGQSANTQFTIGVSDGSCPIENLASYPVNINVINSTVVNAPITICGGQVANLTAVGGSVFTWYYTATGLQVPVGPEFSCNPCANPIATPLVSTDYYVISNLAVGCNNTDSTSVTVSPDFTPTVSQSSPSACLFDPIQLDVQVAPAVAGYTYSWTPATYLDFTNIPNPLATIAAPGTYTYYVDIISPGGCLKTDSITVTITPFVAPNIDILTPDSIMLCGDSILIDLDLGGGVPALCGPSPTNTCSGPTTLTTVGTGSANISSAPSPYYGFYEDSRVQMIYTALELNALGFMGGKITEIAFEIVTQASTQNYNGFNIKMGCTALPDFQNSTTFEPGLTQVYSNVSYAPALGWNTHTLNTAYEWDGISNLIVEVCFDNSSWTSTDAVAQTATPVKMVMYDYTDGAVGCTLNTPYNNTQQLNRPNIRLTQCPTIPDPLAFNYAWTPATNIITSTMQNPTVFPSVPTTYLVTVTDTGGNCFDTDSINISVLCGACYQPAITVTNPTCKDGTNGSIVVDPTFVLGSELQSFTWQDSLTGAVLQTTMNLTNGMLDSLVNIGAGAYTITMVDSSGCSQDTTIYLTEPDSVMITTITQNNTICIGGSTQISATAVDGNGGPYTYTWTNLNTGAVIPGNGPHTVSPIDTLTCYSVFATDQLGCISSPQQVCISLFDSIVATSLIASTSNDSLKICPNASQDIDIVAVGGMGAPYTYTWFENNVQIGSGTLINVTPTGPSTTYIGVAYDNCSTPADSVIIYIDWYGLVTPSIIRNKPDSCYPFTVEFTNTSTPTNLIASSQWSVTNGDAGVGNSIFETFDTPTCQDVTLTITTIDGCIVTETWTDYVCPHDYPVANFSTDPAITNIMNTEIEFKNLTTGGTIPYTYLWNFDSGLSPDTSVVTHPIFTYPNIVPGVYSPTLTVTDANGCQDDVEGTVIINGIYIFYAPNSFTPDGDGLNETFRPYGEGIDFSMYSMEIYNRWGELMYHTVNAERGWDGTYKGELVKAGTYIWKIIAKEEYGTIIHDNYGHVNVIK